MSDVRELYQEVIIDHSRCPRNHHDMAHATHHAEGFNPLCGDKLDLYLSISNNLIQDASFVGKGCAISQASASMMTDLIQGKTTEEAVALFERFRRMVTEESVPDLTLDKLAVLAGVRVFPARVKCATLAWHALEAALKDKHQAVTTE